MSRTYEPTAGSCARVRRDVLGFLAVIGVPDDETDAAVMIANELASNAIDHAGTPFGLALTLTERYLRIEVTDGSTTEPRLQPPDPRAARGRGLQMIDHLAATWTWHVDRHGKRVTADLALPAADIQPTPT